MSFYLKVILFFRRLGIGKPIAEGNYREILRAWKFGSVIVGDLIEIDNQIRLFAGMNKNGAPGQVHYAMIGMPSPEFIPATPFEERAWLSFDIKSFPYWKKLATDHRKSGDKC